MWESGPLGTGCSAAAQFLPLFHANPRRCSQGCVAAVLGRCEGDPRTFNGRRRPVSVAAMLLDPHIVERSLRLARTSGTSPYWEPQQRGGFHQPQPLRWLRSRQGSGRLPVASQPLPDRLHHSPYRQTVFIDSMSWDGVAGCIRFPAAGVSQRRS